MNKFVLLTNVLLFNLLITYTIHANNNELIASPPLRKIEITSPFGYRNHPILKRKIFHTGIDLRANFEDVYSVLHGEVIEIGENKRSGKYIKILHNNNIITSYCHLNGINVNKSQQVKAGDRIGESGNTGYSTSPHLHFSIKINDKYYDPVLFFKEILKIRNI